jgi:hypothetical protein
MKRLVLALWLVFAATAAQAQGQCLVPIDGAATPVVGTSGQVATGGLILKAAPGCLIAAYLLNSTTAGYLMVFNSITVPADGAVTPIHCIPIAASSYQYLNFAPQPPEWYSTGISVAFSTTGCFTKTVSSALFIHGLVQ